MIFTELESWFDVNGDLFQKVCAAKKMPVPDAEFRFAPPRKWRFDYAWPASKVALEVEGGAWTSGRHTRGAGFVKDIEKYNAATVAGWRVLRCTPDKLLTADTLDMIRSTIESQKIAAPTEE